MIEKAKITATWHLSLNCDCPNCGEYVDLIEADDFWDGKPVDFVCQNGTDRANNLHVFCPKCEHEFNVCCEY